MSNADGVGRIKKLDQRANAGRAKAQTQVQSLNKAAITVLSRLNLSSNHLSFIVIFKAHHLRFRGVIADLKRHPATREVFGCRNLPDTSSD